MACVYYSTIILLAMKNFGEVFNLLEKVFSNRNDKSWDILRDDSFMLTFLK